MCHFIWKDNQCQACGQFFDRKLVSCNQTQTRKHTTCSRVYFRENDADFKCQQCLVTEAPWRRVKPLESQNNEEYYSDDSGDEDFEESDGSLSDNDESTNDDGDYEDNRGNGSLKRSFQDADFKFPQRQMPKRKCRGDRVKSLLLN
ncbi:hypothetical protein CCHR01_10929 [Colletotrichum chrysophilum]|uniref:Uncharacterized protein n=1 Tax=Colletotrichum chrysophilum TaxID=1836956 RepID=A0AAD9AE21_9PEZI|nr:hypothetical protein CCHR01_10929 [Colletotrichum chrysophilum]